MNAELNYEITHFLHHEARLQDERKYEEWLHLLADDLVYRMPVRVTTEGKDGEGLVDEMTYFEETKISLTTRVKRLQTTSAWVQDPPPRHRHFITNIMIEPGSRPDEYLVRSNFLFLRSRASDHTTEQMFGERVDVLRKVQEEWKIASRTINPDQAVLTVMNLSMFL